MINRILQNTPPVVKNLLIINALFFLAQSVLPITVRHWIIENLALFFWDSVFFKPHQILSYMFLHANLSHFFLNMFSLWMFGRILEYDLGSKRFLIYYVVSAIGAAVIHMGVTWFEVADISASIDSGAASLQMLYNRVNTPTLGASGAVYGLLLGFGLMHPNSVIMLLIPPIPIKAKYFVIIYGLLELVLGFTSSSNIAHFAHLGGMIWGFLLLQWWKKRGTIYF